jgi:hypothetical protein
MGFGENEVAKREKENRCLIRFSKMLPRWLERRDEAEFLGNGEAREIMRGLQK